MVKATFAGPRAARVLLNPGRRAALFSLLLVIYFFSVYQLFYAPRPPRQGQDRSMEDDNEEYQEHILNPVAYQDIPTGNYDEPASPAKPPAESHRKKPNKGKDGDDYLKHMENMAKENAKHPDIVKEPADYYLDKGSFIDELVKENEQQEQREKLPPLEIPDMNAFRTSGKGYPDPTGMNLIKKMMKHAWGSYVKYAWGYDELRPISKNGRNWHGSHSIGATAIDSLDTLWIMGLKEEFEAARNLTLALDFNVPIYVSFFETTIRVVGGLCSAYDLSGDERFIKKAVEVADRLLAAFNTPTRIPDGQVNLQTGDHRPQSWASGSILAEYGSIQLEYPYLSDVTGDLKYRKAAMDVIDYVADRPKSIPGLFPTTINSGTGNFQGGEYTVGALADSFYEYLLKCWLASDRDAIKFREMYDKSAEAINKYLIRRTAKGDLYLGSGTEDYVSEEMEHLTCFAGGMFALGAITQPIGNWQDMFYIGGNLTETCYKMYRTQVLGIGAEKTRISSWTPLINYYILRPEVVESIFYMWRFTHQEKYREWALDIALAIEQWCRVDGGYAGIQNIQENPPRHNDNQESFFLAETLKYLYLTFTSDDVIPLDRYVFNTEAHPISTAKYRRKAIKT